MNYLVKNAFLYVMYATIALTLFFLMFGQQATGWKGLLFYFSEGVEGGISNYYYSYCYVPAVHETDSTDKALGASNIAPVSDTPSDLSDTDTEITEFGSTGTSYEKYYSTGWVSN